MNFVNYQNKYKILSKYGQSTHLIQIAFGLRTFPRCWNVASARMRLHSASGLVVLRIFIPYREHCW